METNTSPLPPTPIKFATKAKKHRWPIIMAIVLLAGGAYWYQAGAGKSTGTKYTLGSVQKGTVIASVVGTGQVSPQSTVSIKPKISSNIISIKVKVGQAVKTGDVIAELDPQDLKTKAEQERSNLKIAQTNLDVKLAGLSNEDRIVAERSLEASKISLETSQSSLENTIKTNAENLKKSQISLDNAQISLDSANRAYENLVSTQGIDTDTNNDDLKNAYDSAKTTINSAAINIRNSISTADDILQRHYFSTVDRGSGYKAGLGARDSQSVNTANNNFDTAKTSYDAFNVLYKTVTASPDWDWTTHPEIADKTLSTLEDMRTLNQNISIVLTNTITSSDLSSTQLDSLKSSVSSQESSLNSSITAIQNAIQNITNAKRGISSNGISSTSGSDNAKAAIQTAKNNLLSTKSSLSQTKLDQEKSLLSAQNDVKTKQNGYESAQAQFNQKIATPRPIDLETLKVQIQQAQNSYNQALDDLGNTKVVAPIDGIIAELPQNVGDAGAMATALATLITKEKIATITLNEVDVAKVKVGQKATLTFSAIDGLTITGDVVEIANLGTVTQGVVSYTTKIAFDTDDDRIKPQMSVSAAITIDQKIDVLTVPNAAIKTSGNGSYVEYFDAGVKPGSDGTFTTTTLPSQKTITTGLADDTSTEVVSGLSEGDLIVTKITAAAGAASATTAARQTSGLGILGGGGGGNFRAGGGAVGR